MKEKQILFSIPMVQAIDQNRKIMTRRTSGLEKVNENPNDYKLYGFATYFNPMIKFVEFIDGNDRLIQCKPRYIPGDYIWVKETYFDTKPFKKAPLFSVSDEFIYKANKDSFIGEHKWKPSLFMPKVAARLWLVVTKVRCERLHDITEDDALEEGVESLQGDITTVRFKHYEDNSIKLKFAKPSFFSLWRKINGKDSVAANPWVFIYEFKKIEK